MGVEAQRNRFTYHFDNPSSFDTADLVPHFFEQRYDADNVWLVGRVRYTAGIRWETAAGVTPERTSKGDDYDTFFNPDGSVVVSGTTGGISMRSFRVSHRAEFGRVGPLTLWSGYRLRVDRSDFLLGHKTVTRNGVLVEAFDVTSPEHTSSQIHEVLVAGRLAREIGREWRLTFDGEIAPATLARLLVQLPEKYPGQDLVFTAKLATLGGQASIARRAGQWSVEIAAGAARTLSYRSTARLARHSIAAGVSVARGW